jgi:hypothetical protein
MDIFFFKKTSTFEGIHRSNFGVNSLNHLIKLQYTNFVPNYVKTEKVEINYRKRKKRANA